MGGRKHQVLVAYLKHLAVIPVHMEGDDLQSCGVIPESAGVGVRPRAGQGLALGPTRTEMKVNAGITHFTYWDGSIIWASWIIPGSPAHQCMGLTAMGAAGVELRLSSQNA